MAKSSRMDHHNFLSKLEKYNSSMQGEASFRVLYYGGATGSVPFVWESQPGTPKHKFSDHPPPPLTPPPQYLSSPLSPSLQKKRSKNSRILNSIFARNPSKKGMFSPPPPSYSLPSTPLHAGKSNSKGRSRSAVHFGLDEDEYEPGSVSPTSTLCFGPRNGSPYRKFKGYSYPIKSVKKAVKSIVGYGNSN